MGNNPSITPRPLRGPVRGAEDIEQVFPVGTLCEVRPPLGPPVGGIPHVSPQTATQPF